MIRYEIYERKARHEINDPRITMGDVMMESPRRENNDEAKIPNKIERRAKMNVYTKDEEEQNVRRRRSRRKRRGGGRAKNTRRKRNPPPLISKCYK